MSKAQSWGLISNDDHKIYYPSNRIELQNTISDTKTGLAYGMGRSYGDVCLNPNGRLWNTSQSRHLISFDQETGLLRCESGVLLRDINDQMVPRGWKLPVTPGTEFVTIGGAIANDIHGKNHHIFGSFGHHVISFKLIRTTGELIECSRDHNVGLFRATIGGLGLTGVILEAEIQLKKTTGPWLEAEVLPYYNLDEFFELSDKSEMNWEYTVSWLDCTSQNTVRGLFMRANPVNIESNQQRKITSLNFPFTPPVPLINRLSLKAFNYAYFKSKEYVKKRIIHYKPFFYPLDSIQGWNKIYGSKGFFQYQCVLPRENSFSATRYLVNQIAASGEGSFLSVLKTFGNRPPIGMLSFPKHGITLALDFPNRGEITLKLFDKLDSIVSDAGGRIYMAKDARMPASLFRQGYPLLNEFLAYRDPGISSAMSRRLMGS